MKIAIIGAGASGLFCAINISSEHEVVLFEKNEKAGKKLLITGNGRCNFTNLKSTNDFLENVMTNNKFLYSALTEFSPYDINYFLNENGIETIEEVGNKMYPKSGKSKLVLDLLLSKIKQNVNIVYNTNISEIIKEDNKYVVVDDNKNKYTFDAIVLSTGGKSYQITGSVGDGYVFASKLGHTISSPRQSLCGLVVKNKVLSLCEGVSFECTASIVDKDKKVYCKDSGPLMITRFGFSGPLSHRLSGRFKEYNISGKFINIDFAHNTTDEMLYEDIKQYGFEYLDATVFDYVKKYLVNRMAKAFYDEMYKDFFDKKVSQLSNENIYKLVGILKNTAFEVLDFDSFDRSVVTRGGVEVNEINPKTMESKINSNLYVIGELLNVDALTGGYSLQIAFSTAYACAKDLNNKI